MITRSAPVVLDLGCGDGSTGRDLAGPGACRIAVDLDTDLLAQVSDATPIRADARALPLHTAAVDHVVIVELLEHLDDPGPREALNEAYRALQPGGTLTVAVPTAYTEHVFWRLHPTYAANATHVRIYTKREIIGLVTAAGFDVTRIETRNLYGAVSWLAHSALRSRSDHAGRIFDHPGVDRVLGRFFTRWARTPGANKLLGGLSRVIGKSWYIHGAKRAHL